MTDKAVSALTSLTGANTATGDLVYIVDISEAAAADRSKKITLGNLFVSVPAGAEATPSIAAQGDQNTGIWFPAADEIAISTGGSRRVSVDATGNIVIGTTSFGSFSGTALGIYGATTARFKLMNSTSGTASADGGELSYTGTELAIENRESGLITVYNGGTERTRVTAGGYFKASNSGTYNNSTGAYHELRSNQIGTQVAYLTHTHASDPYGINITFSSSSPDNNTNFFLECSDSTTARCRILSDGDIVNHDGTYGTISDQKLKQDIVDAASQWDDIKAIRFRKYRMKSDVESNPNAPYLLGVVAQEIEQTSPGLVDEHPDMETVEVQAVDADGNPVVDDDGNPVMDCKQQATGTTTKSVKSSILLMKAAKALQEAMARIEQLEAKVTALEAR